MLNNLNVDRERTDNIYLVDVKHEFKRYLPSDIQEKAIPVTHNGRNTNNLARFTAAYQLIEMYASAKLVITQRIHCALPCVAMGTPVIFINSAGIPGGGGSQAESSQRTVGLTPLFHTLDLYTMTTEDAKACTCTYFLVTIYNVNSTALLFYAYEVALELQLRIKPSWVETILMFLQCTLKSAANTAVTSSVGLPSKFGTYPILAQKR